VYSFSLALIFCFFYANTLSLTIKDPLGISFFHIFQELLKHNFELETLKKTTEKTIHSLHSLQVEVSVLKEKRKNILESDDHDAIVLKRAPGQEARKWLV
jgi:FtsZ-binding cell division protein ZapB